MYSVSYKPSLSTVVLYWNGEVLWSKKCLSYEHMLQVYSEIKELVDEVRTTNSNSSVDA